MLTLINSGGDYAAFFAVQIRSVCGNYKSDIKQLFVKKIHHIEIIKLSSKIWALELIKNTWEVRWNILNMRNDAKQRKDNVISLIESKILNRVITDMSRTGEHDLRRWYQCLFAGDKYNRLYWHCGFGLVKNQMKEQRN